MYMMTNYDEFKSAFQSVSKDKPVPEEEILLIAEKSEETEFEEWHIRYLGMS